MHSDGNQESWRRQRLREWKTLPSDTDAPPTGASPMKSNPPADATARRVSTAESASPRPRESMSGGKESGDASPWMGSPQIALLLQELEMRRGREAALERRLAEYEREWSLVARRVASTPEEDVDLRRTVDRLSRELEAVTTELREKESEVKALKREVDEARQAAADAITTAAARLAEITAVANVANTRAPPSPTRRTPLDATPTSAGATANTTGVGVSGTRSRLLSTPRRTSPSLFPQEPPSLRRVPSPLAPRVPSPNGRPRVPSPFARRTDGKSSRPSDASRLANAANGGTTARGASHATTNPSNLGASSVTPTTSVPRTSRPVIAHASSAGGGPSVQAGGAVASSAATRTVVSHVRAQEAFRTPKFETAYRPSRLVRHYVWERAEDVAERCSTPQI